MRILPIPMDSVARTKPRESSRNKFDIQLFISGSKAQVHSTKIDMRPITSLIVGVEMLVIKRMQPRSLR